MKYNPTKFTWTHSGLREDGSETTELAYNAYIDGELIASFPGTLNPDGKYEMLFADLGWTHSPGVEHEFSLTAFETQTGLESNPSAPEVLVWVGKPQPPSDLAVA